MKDTETARRLREAMSDADLTATELAEKAGIQRSSVSQYANGFYVPSNISAGKMAEVLGVSPMWLMGFEVDKYYDFHSDGEREKRLLAYWRKLSEQKKDVVEKLIKTMADK